MSTYYERWLAKARAEEGYKLAQTFTVPLNSWFGAVSSTVRSADSQVPNHQDRARVPSPSSPPPKQPHITMRLSTLLSLIPLAGFAAADYMTVTTHCFPTSCNTVDGRWHSAYGTYFINASDGCHDPQYVPDMTEICIDWARGRAHFYFRGQNKRCLRMDSYEWDESCYSPQYSCYQSRWNEVPCTW
ncbi:hypothetical protein VTK26DRAFT_8260 [Humicola hyalothermophila]